MPDVFQTFGLPPDKIQPTCLLTPFLYKGINDDFPAGPFHKGLPYSAAEAPSFTLIYTRPGAQMAGDAVLLLKDTPCRRIIFVGACGLMRETKEAAVGSLFCPEKSFNFESLTDMIEKKNERRTAPDADADLSQRILKTDPDISPAVCATVGSLELENNCRAVFEEHGVDILDQECSAVFSAARYCGLPAAALLYATDLVGHGHPLAQLPKNAALIRSAQKKAAESVKRLRFPNR